MQRTQGLPVNIVVLDEPNIQSASIVFCVESLKRLIQSYVEKLSKLKRVFISGVTDGKRAASQRCLESSGRDNYHLTNAYAMFVAFKPLDTILPQEL